MEEMVSVMSNNVDEVGFFILILYYKPGRYLKFLMVSYGVF